MARYIDADKIVDIIKTDIKQCEIDVSESCGDEFYEMAVNSRSSAMYSILREIESAPTADVVPKSEVEQLNKEFDELAEEHSNLIIEKDQLFDIAEKQKAEIETLTALIDLKNYSVKGAKTKKIKKFVADDRFIQLTISDTEGNP